MKILLVDDDPGVIQALLPILKSEPADEVRVATTGAKGLEHAQAMAGPDLLLVDVVMEGMNGFELRAAIDAEFLHVRTVFLSGYDLTAYTEQLAGAEVLPKPVDPQTLREVLGLVPPLEPEALESPEDELPPEEEEAAEPVEEEEAEPAFAPAPRWPSDYLEGRQVGAYEIEHKIGEGRWGSVYRAIQTSIGRPVALKILAGHLREDPASRNQFVADASAKAAVQHPSIVTVYEAGEADGQVYYTHEFIEGETLASFTARGGQLDEGTALRLIRTAADGLAYLGHARIPHLPLAPTRIYLGADGWPRLANLATRTALEASPARDEIQRLGTFVTEAAVGADFTPEAHELLTRMTDGGWASWQALLQAVKALEPEVAPVDAYQLSAQDEAAIQAVDRAKRRQKRSLFLGILGIFALLWLAGGAIWFVLFRTNEKKLDQQIVIPAGPFPYQTGEPVTLPAFSIDQYEVTIGEYARFVQALQRQPSTQWDHPEQPPGKSHRPPNWDIFSRRAAAGKPVDGVAIDLNCPAFMVDWWDAYAYAKWKGRRLPTEQEWERAARGPHGLLFPWGSAWDPKKCNGNADFGEKGSLGSVDGFTHWSPVDAVKTDASAEGVIGLAGNVSEWTASWDPAHRHPVIRGGNYARNPSDAPGDFQKFEATHRVDDLNPGSASEVLGFRTAGDAPQPSSSSP